MITPQTLKALAEAMGKRVAASTEYLNIITAQPEIYDPVAVFIIEDNGAFTIFQPHKDPAQAFEVLEWLIGKSNILYGKRKNGDCFVIYAPNTKAITSPTLQEAIVLAAIALLESDKC